MLRISCHDKNNVIHFPTDESSIFTTFPFIIIHYPYIKFFFESRMCKRFEVGSLIRASLKDTFPTQQFNTVDRCIVNVIIMSVLD